MSRLLIIAHRGASAFAPENTLMALRMAIEAGADGVEFDVRLAKDGIPVVIHDATLKRTAGVKMKVADLTSAQLAEIDVGSWFNKRHRKFARTEFSQETVQKLETVLGQLSGSNRLVYLELKCGRTSLVPLVDSVCELVRYSPIRARIIIKSFRLAAIRQVRQRLSDVQTAALFDPSIVNILRRRRNIVDVAREAGAQQLSVHRSLATPRLVSAARRAGMPLTVWTVDDPKWLARADKLGITALITNDPARMLRAGQYQAWPTESGWKS